MIDPLLFTPGITPAPEDAIAFVVVSAALLAYWLLLVGVVVLLKRFTPV